MNISIDLQLVRMISGGAVPDEIKHLINSTDDFKTTTDTTIHMQRPNANSLRQIETNIDVCLVVCVFSLDFANLQSPPLNFSARYVRLRQMTVIALLSRYQIVKSLCDRAKSHIDDTG